MSVFVSVLGEEIERLRSLPEIGAELQWPWIGLCGWPGVEPDSEGDGDRRGEEMCEP